MGGRRLIVRDIQPISNMLNCVTVLVRGLLIGWRKWRIGDIKTMSRSNLATSEPKGGAQKSEFEALKRFGDYAELHDGTLMRAEGEIEFRIYCEDVGGCPIGILTGGVLKLFADLWDDAPREADDATEP
jgi:hypothetical protein